MLTEPRSLTVPISILRRWQYPKHERLTRYAYLGETELDSQRYMVQGYGDIRPIASNETEDRRQLNRRVEVVLYAGI